MNPYDPPTTTATVKEGETPSPQRRLSRNAIFAIAFSLFAPIATSFLVVDSLVGTENLKRHYWFNDGILISAVLNTVFLLPLFHRKVRLHASAYAICTAMLITLLAYGVYWYWIVALIGV